MEQDSFLLSPWRLRLLKQLDLVLVVFEVVASAIFISLSYLTDSVYFRGVGVGLVIAGVTSVIAVLVKRKVATT
jgi:hypothetical protein